MKKQPKPPPKVSYELEKSREKWQEAVSGYLNDVNQMNKEQARSHRFAMFLQEILGFEPDFIETFAKGIETSLKAAQKDRILRGEADNLFGNVIIEFERDIIKKRFEAEEQLCSYVAILWSQEPMDSRTPYLCVATDGVHFVTYAPVLSKSKVKDVAPEDIRLNVLEESDWKKLKPEEVFYWLDRYFLRKEVLLPTSETILRDFGAKSHAFQRTTNALLRLWQEIKQQSAFSVIFQSWGKYLHIVYGSAVGEDELFIRHTYLATLAKLMSWMRVSGNVSLPEDKQIVEILEGQLFKKQGIENFIEEDFFSWLARSEAVKMGVNVVHWLFSLLQNYRLGDLSEDVLKSLYQELVDPETRHDLGEFYTPDWLAHRIVNKLLDTNSHGALLDPACGSGTFLYLAIREKRRRLGDSFETLEHILDSVYGADIHPLAVMVAKTNYILALSDLLWKRKGPITIPIYLADMIKLPESVKQTPAEVKNGALVPALPGYQVELEGQKINLPERLFDEAALYDQAVELAKDFALQNKNKSITLNAFCNFLTAQHFPKVGDQTLVQAVFAITEKLKYFIDNDRDTIWSFVLKNIYKPLFFKCKFDFIMGNPPWISFRYMEPGYQEFLKRQITDEYRLLAKRGELITHLEIATLFLVRAADLFLKTKGIIAFVLPRGLFSSDQHDGLRRHTFKFSEDRVHNLFWRELWDCESVQPLFKVPACVIFADKLEPGKENHPLKPDSPIKGEILSGILDRKNASLSEVEKNLAVTDVLFSLNIHGKRSFWAVGKETKIQGVSFYKKEFAQGATIVPRSFWFVQVKASPLGFDPNRPPIETDARAIEEAKKPYRDVKFEGNVENRFIYATLLSTDLLPFGHLGYRLVLLPIKPEGNQHKIVVANEALKYGFLNLAQWLEKSESEWIKRRGAKAERMTIYERLDRVHGLTNQNPEAKYRVIYNTSGTFLTAAVVVNKPIDFEIKGQHLAANGFIVDHKTYRYESSNKHEAYYLGAVLNAPVIDELIKPMQSRGLFGPRDIHKKVLELPIPRFDSTNPIHNQLEELGNECEKKVENWLRSGDAGKIKSIGKLRSMVRAILKDDLKQIDILVKKIL